MLYIVLFTFLLIVVFVLVCRLYAKPVQRGGDAVEHYQSVKGDTRSNNNGIKLEDMDIYLINLKRNKERLEHFIEEYMMSDLRYKAFNRLDAVDGSKVALEDVLSDKALAEIKEIESTGYRTKHYQLTRGAIGCYLSHKKLYDKIASGNAPYGLIFEDDVIIDKNIFAKLNKTIREIPNDWDMLLLGCHCITCDRFKTYMDIGRFFLLHCYIVKKEAAQKLVDHLSQVPISQQIDSELSDMTTSGKLKVYCLKQSLCKQGNGLFGTTIQKPIKKVPGVNPYAPAQ